MRKYGILLTFFFLILINASSAQKSVRISYKRIINAVIDNNSEIKISESDEKALYAETIKDYSNIISSFSPQPEYIDFNTSTYFQTTFLSGQQITKESPLPSDSLLTITNEEKNILGYTCRLAHKTVFSNRIDIWFCESLPQRNTPYPSLGIAPGSVLKIVINNNSGYEAIKIEPLERATKLPKEWGEILTTAEYHNRVSENHVNHVPVFDQVQIHFNPSKKRDSQTNGDNVFHYSKGTVAVKKVTLPPYANHTIFGKITQSSNGDAYDRTGSFFLIPTDKNISFMDALTQHLDLLPKFIDCNNVDYPGIISTPDYNVPVELIRFFTPFGIGHYNSKRSVTSIEWEKEAYYAQDITKAITPYCGQEVWLGIFIANYDKGGHIVDVSLDFHPNSEKLIVEEKNYGIIPLFNTLNIMEMSGQPYAKMFENDSLTVTFTIPEGVKNPQLRFISTGHGGWANGDEFLPKENKIYLDDALTFRYIPWREDCNSFRKHNPSSGNFWNGVSSSDLSRSGWCPGSITNPYYIPLDGISPGQHSITVAIPMGKPEENSFSSWNISGAIVFEVIAD